VPFRLLRIPAASLANLIAVALIVIVLFGILIPLLVRGLEVYRKYQCTDNLRAIAMAAHKYHKDHGCLPPGWIGPNPDGPFTEKAPNVGAIVLLLPYLDEGLADDPSKRPYFQGDLNARTDPATNPDNGQTYSPPSNAAWWTLSNPATVANNMTIAQRRFRYLLCPSASQSQDCDGVLGALQVYGPGAPEKFVSNMVLTEAVFPGASKLGRTNYLGSAGMAGSGGKTPLAGPGARPGATWDDFEGVFGNRSTLTLQKLAAQDGTANTLMFGESLAGVGSAADDAEYRYAFSWFCGALPTYYGLPEPGQNTWRAFSSSHTDVVLFAFADGSVRGLRRRSGPMALSRINQANGKSEVEKLEGITTGPTTQPFSDAWWVLQQLAGRRDGDSMLVPRIDD
jgi:hypothetical protein